MRRISLFAICPSVSTTNSFSRARHSGLQIVEGIAPKHRHPALTHDGAGVVVSIYQMNRNTPTHPSHHQCYARLPTMAGSINVVEHPFTELASYAEIPIAFLARSAFDVTEGGYGRFVLVERQVIPPYLKDYDAIESPKSWPLRFDVQTWAMLAAYRDEVRVGGAVIAFDTAGVELLEGRADLAVLWDLRVHPEMRRQGVGGALFAAAVEWAQSQGCSELKVETQNINVPACRFYARQGCDLRRVSRHAYPSLPEEIQLLWYKTL